VAMVIQPQAELLQRQATSALEGCVARRFCADRCGSVMEVGQAVQQALLAGVKTRGNGSGVEQFWVRSSLV
jgi:hypothetical protein